MSQLCNGLADMLMLLLLIFCHRIEEAMRRLQSDQADCPSLVDSMDWEFLATSSKKADRKSHNMPKS